MPGTLFGVRALPVHPALPGAKPARRSYQSTADAERTIVSPLIRFATVSSGPTGRGQGYSHRTWPPQRS